MKWFSFSVIFLVLAISCYAENATAVSVLFDASGTDYVYLPVQYLQIRGFSFNITGSNYSGNYPHNITIDVLNDSVIDWRFQPYPSETPLVDSTVLSATTQTTTSARIYIKSNMSAGNSGTTLGSIKSNQFFRNDISFPGIIGLTANENLISNIVAITTNATTVHAFIPSANPIGKAGFYVAQGGSTYYCNSNHSFYYTTGCDLTSAQAFNSANLAREANITTGLSWMEPVVSHSITDKINQFLPGCGKPCNIVIKITSGSAGNITLEDFKVIGPEGPAKINVQNNTNSYRITIQKNNTLTDVKYGFMTKPNVYIVPIVAKDDTPILFGTAQIRLQTIADTIASKWDRLTNNSHPLNFTVYMTPMQLRNFSTTGNYSDFRLEAERLFLNKVKSPGILVLADVRDYFPDKSPYNERTTLDDRGLISIIYLNGFTNAKSVSGLDNYTDTIFPDILLHELAHTFIIYPSKGKLFYGGHPASFTSLAGFSTYSIAESINDEEGYFEPHSILNQLCPYIVACDPTLSPLDRMFLGTLNQYAIENYTYYKGNTVLTGNSYIQSGLSATTNYDAATIYLDSTDYQWWDVRTATNFTDAGIMEIITLPKTNQDGRALMVYANDAAHTDNFQVSNFGATSSTALANNTPFVELLSPVYGYNSTTNNVTVSCRAYNKFDLLTLYANTTGKGELVEIYNTTQSELTYEFTNLTEGSYGWGCFVSWDRFSTGSDGLFFVKLPAQMYCGDRSCNNGESCSTCPQDCGSCPPVASSGGGGGGGGGKGVPPGTQISQYWDVLRAGESMMNIGSFDFGVKGISFQTHSESYKVTLKVSKVFNISKSIVMPAGPIYKVFEVNQTNFPGSESILMRFSVKKEWLQNNSVLPNDAVLKRFVSPFWVDLGTTVVNQSDKYFYYDAVTPGFSFFVIGTRAREVQNVTKKSNQSKEQNITTQVMKNPINNTKEKAVPTFNASKLGNISKLGKANGQGHIKLYLIIAATSSIVFALIFIFIRRKNQS